MSLSQLRLVLKKINLRGTAGKEDEDDPFSARAEVRWPRRQWICR